MAERWNYYSCLLLPRRWVWRLTWRLDGFYELIGYDTLLHANGMNKLHIMIWPYLLWNLPLHISIPYHTRHSPCACLFPHCLTIIWSCVCAMRQTISIQKEKIFVQTATSRSLTQGDYTHPSIFEAGTSFSARFTILGLVIAKSLTVLFYSIILICLPFFLSIGKLSLGSARYSLFLLCCQWEEAGITELRIKRQSVMAPGLNARWSHQGSRDHII